MPLKDLKGIIRRDQHPKGLVIELLLALHSFCVLKGCQYHCCGSWWAEMKWAGHKPYFRLQTSTSRYLPSGNSTQRKRKKIRSKMLYALQCASSFNGTSSIFIHFPYLCDETIYLAHRPASRRPRSERPPALRPPPVHPDPQPSVKPAMI